MAYGGTGPVSCHLFIVLCGWGYLQTAEPVSWERASEAHLGILS